MVRVFALNYATSCGNVCHQKKAEGKRGGKGAKKDEQEMLHKKHTHREREAGREVPLSAAEAISLFSTGETKKGNKRKAATTSPKTKK